MVNPTEGKRLEDLVYEVDVLHKYVFCKDNGACISWTNDDTLMLFSWDNGSPAVY